MNTNCPQCDEMVCFLADEMSSSDSFSVADSARLIREARQATFFFEGDRPVLIIWARERWAYTMLTGKKCLLEMSEIMADFYEHMLGSARRRILPPWILTRAIRFEP